MPCFWEAFSLCALQLSSLWVREKDPPAFERPPAR